jgi:glycosyltransferase involved in cell wall biosynthesis
MRRSSPRVLLVDSSRGDLDRAGPVWDDVVGYGAVHEAPRWLRSCEQYARFDFSLARAAIREARHFDLILAGSEKVGAPLAMMRPTQPVVCVVHQIASPVKSRLLKVLNVASGWSRVGYQCHADRDVLMSAYGIPSGRLFQFKAAPFDTFSPLPHPDGQYVLSLGTSKRDYDTLLKAVDRLPGVPTRVYASSRFLDPYRGRRLRAGQPWIEIKDPVGPEAMPDVYRSARVVVLPLEQTYQYSAGTSVALEAHAAGRAVVATDTPGMKDFVVHGVTGYLVPVGDADAMKDAIARLWTDPRLAAEMGLAGRAHVEKHFDPVVLDASVRQTFAEACEEFQSMGV